jgi:hypothetical protein
MAWSASLKSQFLLHEMWVPSSSSPVDCQITTTIIHLNLDESLLETLANFTSAQLMWATLSSRFNRASIPDGLHQLSLDPNKCFKCHPPLYVE